MANNKALLLRAIHWLIIINFLGEIFYASWMLFVILAPKDGSVGPLAERALTMPFEQMATRRLYAIECWIAMAGLAIYLALTEMRLIFRSKTQ
ncbi:MAG: hypothetical protein AAB425_06840 [Bdellovibrionota bacterium]